MNNTKLADLAVSILSQLPTPKVEAFSARGGVVLLELQSQDGVYIIAEAPRPQVRDQLDLLVRTNEISGGGYDISLSVAETLHQTESTISVRLLVRDVLRRESERATPRAAVPACLTRQYSAADLSCHFRLIACASCSSRNRSTGSSS